MSDKPDHTRDVIYHPPRSKKSKLPTTSIAPIGLDTEADVTGETFMICTSLGDVWTPDRFPACMFDRKHRDRAYVTWNLKYDMGALLQTLPVENLEQLRKFDKTTVGEYRYRVIANKLLSISKGKKHVQIYDMMGFYKSSLDKAAKKYLDDAKINVGSKSFDHYDIQYRWEEIAEYCVQDCILTARLADKFIKQLNSWGMHVRKLYSTAHISYAWFSSKCGHPSVGWIWRFQRTVLNYAMASYAGGKFEVTKKGPGYFYEYDLVSAYPHSIRDLVDLDNARIVWSDRYRKYAVYGFLDCTMIIPPAIPSPVAVKRGYLNTYPAGEIRKIITKREYEYLIESGCDVTINSACWIHVDKKNYLYRDEIDRLFTLKSSIDKDADKMAYQTVKVLMNSLYGKFVQLIPQGDLWRAGSSWNPIFASYITAETRVRVSELQRQYPSVRAVHTDSIISDEKLDYPESSSLGSLSYEIEGQGLIAGCGVYQIGKKTALRGVPSKIPLLELCRNSGQTLNIENTRSKTWRQVLATGHPVEEINLFVDAIKQLRPDSDKKRIWLSDSRDWQELRTRTIESLPLVYARSLYQ